MLTVDKFQKASHYFTINFTFHLGGFKNMLHLLLLLRDSYKDSGHG